MISAIIGVPGLPWTHFLTIANTLMIPVTRIRKGSPITTFAPPTTRFVGGFHLVHVADPSLIVKHQEFFQKENVFAYIVCAGSETRLKELSIPIRPNFSVPEFIQALTSKEDPTAINMTREKMEDVLFWQLTQGSILGELHTLFYRIVDPKSRDRVRNAVYEYLAGIRLKKPKTSVQAIDDILSSPTLPDFIEACKSVANGDTRPTDHPSLDPFEIMYTLKKSGSL